MYTPKVVVASLLLACMACSDETPVEETPVATPTAIGEPLGPPVTAEIGPSGGSLISADGRLSLQIPPGALASTQTIGIQPIKNHAPGGQGVAYRLTPSNLQFAQSVTLQLQYEETENNPVGVAVQDKDGGWHSLNPRQISFMSLSSGREAFSHRPAAVKTLSATIPGEWDGDVAVYDRFYLTPVQAEVDVGKTVELNVLDSEGLCNAALGQTCHPADSDVFVVPLVPSRVKSGTVWLWYILGSPVGSDTLGTVDGPSPFNPVTYTAPLQVPSPNPVTVSAKLDMSQYNSSASVELISRIRVKGVSPWTGTVTYTARGTKNEPVTTPATGEGRKITYEQTETFTVKGVKDQTATGATLIFEATSSVKYDETYDRHETFYSTCVVNGPTVLREAKDWEEQDHRNGTGTETVEGQLYLGSDGNYSLYLDTIGADLKGQEVIKYKYSNGCFPEQSFEDNDTQEHQGTIGDNFTMEVEGNLQPATPSTIQGSYPGVSTEMLVTSDVKVEWSLTRNP